MAPRRPAAPAAQEEECALNEWKTVAAGLLVPLLGTTLGAAGVFFLRRELSPAVQRVLLGFAAGVMTAASVWSLLLPAIRLSGEAGRPAWAPATAGFLAGAAFLVGLDGLTRRLCERAGRGENSRRTCLLALSVTLHNIPEGMAVGVAFAGTLGPDAAVSAAGAYALALGIAVQNIPEGGIVSLPLAGLGMSRSRAFRRGFCSGAVEPAFGALTVLLSALVRPILPAILSFAAGAMFYVVAGELLPEARGDGASRAGALGAVAGFALMMLLDVAFG